MSQPVPITLTKLRNLIRNAEAKADESLIAKLDLMAQLLRTRQSEKMPSPHVGQDGLVRLARSIQAAVESQNNLFRTHDALTRARREVYADLPHDDTPDYEATTTAEAAA
jgi:hypothetical protein